MGNERKKSPAINNEYDILVVSAYAINHTEGGSNLKNDVFFSNKNIKNFYFSTRKKRTNHFVIMC